MKKRKRTEPAALFAAAALILGLAAVAIIAALRPHAEGSVRFMGPDDYVSPTSPPPASSKDRRN